MDRFIAPELLKTTVIGEYLKSNMDRFIVVTVFHNYYPFFI